MNPTVAKFAVTVGEVEHSGDLDYTVRQLRAIPGVSAVAVESTDFDGGSARFIVTTTLGRGEFRAALETAGVCL